MFGLEAERAAALVEEEGVRLRAFLGYAGWSGGQLETELARDTWVVSPLLPDLMEREPDATLWRGVLGEMDHEWKLLADEPDDPSAN